MANEKLVNKSNLKAFRQAFQKAIEDGDIIASKALVAKQLENVSDESGSYQDKPYLFQATGTDSNTTETPTAPVAKHLELRGNTVVFNQLVDTDTTEIIPVAGHKYLTNINSVKIIVTPADDTPINVTGGIDNVFDLTKMFGAGKEPVTVVQFNRLFPLPYYAYNTGELKSCKSNKLVTIGYNQFENLNQFIEVVAGQTYRLMYWNETALAALTSGSIEEYDGAQTLIQTTTYDNLSDLHTIDNTYPDNGDKGIKLTDETHYVKIISSSNANILFNIAWDGSRSDYESYVKHEYTLPNWTNGKSAGDAYDSYYPNGKIIQRIKSVDLGTLDWSYTNDLQFFYVSLEDAKLQANAYTVANIVCTRYEARTYDQVANLSTDDMGIAISLQNYGAYPRLVIKNKSYTNADTFKAAMSGVILYYELAEYITTTGNQTFPENVEVDDFGTMKFTTTEIESASNPIIPQGNRFFYPADYALLIDDLNQYTNGDVGALLKNTQVKAGGTALVPDADGNVNIPKAQYGVYGLVQSPVDANKSGVAVFDSGNSIPELFVQGITAPYWTNTSVRNSNPNRKSGHRQPIVIGNMDYAVKLAMTDNIGAAWTDTEKAAGRARMGSAVALTQSTDLTPTTQTLTLTANTRYALGTLTALSLTFPTTNVNDGDEIVIEFISGSTATTLTLDNVNAVYNFSSVGADKFVELNSQYKVSIDKWVVYSAETDYVVV